MCVSSAANRTRFCLPSSLNSGVRLFGIAVVLPLLAVRLMEARARQAFVAARGGRPTQAALPACL